VAGGEEEAVAGQPVDVRGGRPHGDPAAVAAEVTPTDVVHQDHQEVGPPAAPAVAVQPGRRLDDLVLVDELALPRGGDLGRGRRDGVEVGGRHGRDVTPA